MLPFVVVTSDASGQSDPARLVMLAGEPAQFEVGRVPENDLDNLMAELQEDVAHTVVGTCGPSEFCSHVVYDKDFLHARNFITFGNVRPSHALCRALGLTAPQDIHGLTETLVRRQPGKRPFYLRDFQPV